MNWAAKQEPIEDNIPMPPIGRPRCYPWQELQVGQSFLVRCPKVEYCRLIGSLTSCANNASKRSGFKYALRWVGNGVRAWRIA